MPGKIEHEDRDGYLFFSIEGSSSLEDSLTLWKEIGSITKEKGSGKILVAESLADVLHDIEMVEIVSHFREIGLARVKIAYTDLRKSNTWGLELAALFANNHGINGKIFQELDEAIAWLTAS